MQTNCTPNDPHNQTEQMTQLPLFPACHYCGQIVWPGHISLPGGLRFCDEICQGYFDVRQAWQSDVDEFLDDQGGNNEQTNVFEGAI